MGENGAAFSSDEAQGHPGLEEFIWKGWATRPGRFLRTRAWRQHIAGPMQTDQIDVADWVVSYVCMPVPGLNLSPSIALL